MKQDYGMFFFFACLLACLLVCPMPDHHCTRLCPFLFCTTTLTPNLQSNCSFLFLVSDSVCCSVKCLKSCRHPVHVVCTTHMRPYYIVLYQFQLICLFFSARTGFSIITWNDVDSAQVCFSITCYNCWWSVSLKSIYCTKKWERGGKQYVP